MIMTRWTFLRVKLDSEEISAIFHLMVGVWHCKCSLKLQVKVSYRFAWDLVRLEINLTRAWQYQIATITKYNYAPQTQTGGRLSLKRLPTRVRNTSLTGLGTTKRRGSVLETCHMSLAWETFTFLHSDSLMKLSQDVLSVETCLSPPPPWIFRLFSNPNNNSWLAGLQT